MGHRIALAIIMLFLIAGCGGDTYESLSGVAESGSPGDTVILDEARVDTIRGITYTPQSDQHFFAVYDKSSDPPEFIMIRVYDNYIDFDPKGGEFVFVRGRLEETPNIDMTDQENWNYYRETGNSMNVVATDVKEIDRPAGW